MSKADVTYRRYRSQWIMAPVTDRGREYMIPAWWDKFSPTTAWYIDDDKLSGVVSSLELKGLVAEEIGNVKR